ncbi:hypothetical protein ACOBQB_12625 [Streptomyces sp. G5(2025)]|uniref:hypothetical protein n=1 Tax=Streptomyces sp. G5(2025) TaxID=3406628 RepID=UPI003C1BD112
MTEPSSLPGDPSELRLPISYDDALADTPQTDTLERWDVTILHRRRTHDDAADPAASSTCVGEGCPLCIVEDAAVGTMTFYRVHLDRGRNAVWAMEEESEELHATAQVLLLMHRPGRSPVRSVNRWTTSVRPCSSWTG